MYLHVVSMLYMLCGGHIGHVRAPHMKPARAYASSKRSAVGPLGITTCVVALVVSVLVAGFYVHVAQHKEAVRIAKEARYDQMAARMQLPVCASPQAQMEADAVEFCSKAHAVLKVPLDAAVDQEAWDNALRSIHGTVNSFSGMVGALLVALVLLAILVRCIWGIVKVPMSGVLPG